MSPTVPDVAISISSKEDSIFFEFRRQGEPPLPVPSMLTAGTLIEFRRDLHHGLNQFWKEVGLRAKVGDPRRAYTALCHLHKVVRGLNYDLFGSRRYRVERFFQEALPAWRRSGTDGYRQPIVEIRSRAEYLIPFEFFPLLDTSEPESSEPAATSPRGDSGHPGLEGLSGLASRFLGFSAIVHRILRDGGQGSVPPQAGAAGQLKNRSRLGLRLFHHAGLEGAREERDFFEETGGIDLRGPWPAHALDTNRFVSELAGLVWNASEGSAESIDQIQHFACHCGTEGPNSRDYWIELADSIGRVGWFGPGHHRRATLGLLSDCFGSYPARPTGALDPVVFFNACGSSKMTPDGVTSYPKMFLLKGCRGFIGTETPIPDQFAAAFSRIFYLDLIDKGPLGQSLYQSRWSMLKRYNNPLGLLYTAYADPDLRVSHPMSKTIAAP